MVRIVSANPLSDYWLKVTFDDGITGVFAVEPESRSGVFLKLLDQQVFNSVSVNSDFGCVEWPGGIDLCPDTMHEAMTDSKPRAEADEVATLREEASKTKPF